MGRPKEFDPQEALERAMEVFWKKGFKATSLQDLVAAMGINRGSLYDTFGGKAALFAAALDRYCERMVDAFLLQLAQPGTPREVLERTFAAEITWLLEESRGHGCFLVNTAVELAPHDPAVRKRVLRAIARLEDGFRALLERGGVEDPPRMAAYLLTCLQGLMVLSKSTSDRRRLGDVVAVALSVVGPA